MTSDLNLWDAPREKGKPLDVLDAGDQVGVTGVVTRGFAQILLDGQVRWVNDDYLSEKKPVAPKADPSRQRPVRAPGPAASPSRPARTAPPRSPG